MRINTNLYIHLFDKKKKAQQFVTYITCATILYNSDSDPVY